MLLLEHGADINQCSSDGRNAFLWASAKGDIVTMKFLLSKGAKMDHEDEQGLNAFDICVVKILYEAALYLSKEHGFRSKPAQFYKEHGASKNFDFELLDDYLAEGREQVSSEEFFARANRE